MSEPESGELVFVYGTLRRGGSNAFRMDGAEFVGAATVGGALYRISWYPGLVLDGDGRVTGEIYRVGAEQLRALDEFEGLAAGEIEGSEYRRVRVEADAGDDEVVEVWVYEWKGGFNEDERIQSGDWLGFQSSGVPPLFTLISAFCCIALPVGLLIAIPMEHSRSPDMRMIGHLIGIAAVVAPLAGWCSAYIGHRRREGMLWLRWAILGISVTLLVMGVIGAVLKAFGIPN